MTGAEFAGTMARLGPWDADRRVAVAVSGGADSLCLALLAHGWGHALAIIVDHGLRAESAGEAAWTARVLKARGLAAQVVTLRGLSHGPALAARAREARYAALAAACHKAGLVDLLVGHHAGDQAETVLMRHRRGSGPAGLAGMAAVAAGQCVRVVRPLLATEPSRLRATLRALGQDWLEDPSNADPAAARTRVRTELAETWPPEARARPGRTAAEHAAALELAAHATIHPAGFAILDRAVGPPALAALMQAIGGRPYPPSPAAIATLASDLRPATLAGVRVLPAGRLGRGWLLVREAAAMAPPVVLAAGAVWDGRFRVGGIAGAGFTLGALGGEAVRFRSMSPWPAAVLSTLPAIRRNNVLSAVPHLEYGLTEQGLAHVCVRSAGPPASPASFVAI